MKVAAPDVCDECNFRLKGGDVGKILLGTYAQIGAPRPRPLDEFRDDILKPDLVREEVVRSEVAVGFGKLLCDAPELPVVDSSWKSIGAGKSPQGSRYPAHD